MISKAEEGELFFKLNSVFKGVEIIILPGVVRRSDYLLYKVFKGLIKPITAADCSNNNKDLLKWLNLKPTTAFVLLR